MEFRRFPALLALLLLASCCTNPKPLPPYAITHKISAQPAASTSFRGLSTPGQGVAWASGSSGNIFRSLDDGAHWQMIPNPGGPDLDFRDVHGIDQNRAWLMAAGTGEASKIYFTTDGGNTWELQLSNPDPTGFFDSLTFASKRRGFLLGDPIDGVFTIFMTNDGGHSWKRLPSAQSPLAVADEHCFAASGTVLISNQDGRLFLATGGSQARLMNASSNDVLETLSPTGITEGSVGNGQGKLWNSYLAPIRQGQAAQGIFSIAFRDDLHGIIVGGDYSDPQNPESICARTQDGGKTWQAIERNGPSGYRSSVAHIPASNPPVWVTVGSHGADWSQDDGRSWQPIANVVGYHAISFSPNGKGIAVGGPNVPFLQLQLNR